MHCRRTSGLFQRFSFSMIKRRENEGGKAFFGFFKLILTMSLFTDKNLTQTIDSNDINIYLPSFTIRNRYSRAISFFRILYKI